MYHGLPILRCSRVRSHPDIRLKRSAGRMWRSPRVWYRRTQQHTSILHQSSLLIPHLLNLAPLVFQRQSARQQSLCWHHRPESPTSDSTTTVSSSSESASFRGTPISLVKVRSSMCTRWSPFIIFHGL